MTGATTRPISRPAASSTVTGLPSMPHRGRDLEPDEAAADHDHAAGLGDPPRELVAVVEGAQVDHAVELRTGYRQWPDPRARGEHQRS